MKNSLQKFRRITKINQKEKIGVFSSGLFLFLGVALMVFFVILYFGGGYFRGFIAGGFILILLLVSGGGDPYSFLRALISTKEKPTWIWGRTSARSLFDERENK